MRSLNQTRTATALGSFMILGAVALLLAASVAAQNEEAMSRWRDTTLDRLEPFLPNASTLGFVPEFSKPTADFKAPANETVSNNLERKYKALLVHKNWYFNDEALFRELEQVRQEKAAVRQQIQTSGEEFSRIHGDEMRAQEKARAAEIDALSKQAEELFRQGKYEEGEAILAKVKPYQPPMDPQTLALDKKESDLYEREKYLLSRRRSVSFRIYTNRTPATTAPAFTYTRPLGTLAGHTLYRQLRGNWDMGGGHRETLVDLAVYLGPANFQNPRVRHSEVEPGIKWIVVWAWIESRPDTIQADEVAVRRVLTTIDYDGLSRLIEP